MKLPHIKQKVALLAGVIILGTTGSIVMGLTNQPKTKADNLPPIVTEVDHQGDQLKNHEARIANLEGDTKALQSNTNTAPTSNTVTVPTVRDTTPGQTITPPPTSTPAPVASIIVTGYREIVIDPDTSDCEYTYSDGSMHRFNWKTTNPKGAWVTDGSGQNGYWQKSTRTQGFCDAQALGLPKPS